MFNRKLMEKKKKEGMESTNHDPSFSKIMKDVEHFALSHTTWKDKKALENKKVVELGGKPQKKQRLPLSVARVQMKRQKEKEEKMLEHNRILGRFGGLLGGASTKKASERKRTPEERVLKSTVGNFKGGVLDVRHMLHSGPSRSNDRGNDMSKNRGGGEGGGGKRKGKKNKGNKKKKKGGGRKRKN